MKKMMFLIGAFCTLQALPDDAEMNVLIQECLTEHGALETKGAHEIVTAHEIKTFVTSAVKEQLRAQHTPFDQLPGSIKKNITKEIEQLCTRLVNEAEKKQQTKLNGIHINTLVTKSMAHTFAQATTCVTNQKLAHEVEASINSLFENAQVQKNTMPKSIEKEFAQKKNAAIDTLKKNMIKGRRDYATKQEITLVVNKVYEGFVDRIKHALKWQWVCAEIESIKKADKPAIPCSSIPKSEESKKAYDKLTFLHKKK